MLKRIMVAMGTACVGGLVLIAAAPATQPTAVQGAPVEVNVNLTCTGTGVQFSVDPWIVEVEQGGEIEWVLNPGADSDAIEISAKTGRWPFAQQTHRGNKQDRARANEMRPNQAGERFQYNITLTCSPEGREPFEVVIDPDIIIK
ncbi:MAG: hypothetical protein JSW51_12265 [Gemmatimonadota bacterium]|nr:MAG: hypothetical protein JSW51_12265 [Gemmatimonadota bacterium]